MRKLSKLYNESKAIKRDGNHMQLKHTWNALAYK